MSSSTAPYLPQEKPPLRLTWSVLWTKWVHAPPMSSLFKPITRWSNAILTSLLIWAQGLNLISVDSRNRHGHHVPGFLPHGSSPLARRLETCGKFLRARGVLTQATVSPLAS